MIAALSNAALPEINKLLSHIELPLPSLFGIKLANTKIFYDDGYMRVGSDVKRAKKVV